MKYGYARVSTDGQSVEAQVRQLTKAGCKKVFREVASGAKTDRAQLRRLLGQLDTGDVLTVTRLDRLARSTRDLLNTLAAITGKKAGFRSLGDTWADTTTSHGRLMLTVLGGLAEFERELICARILAKPRQLPFAHLDHRQMSDGLWKDRRHRLPSPHQPRRRRDCLGELVQIDGSEHAWFEDRGAVCTLLAFVDDATSRLMTLRFVVSESAFDYFRTTRAYLETHGKPVAFYSDKHNIFRVNNGEGGNRVTQFGRALEALNIDIICANSWAIGCPQG